MLGAYDSVGKSYSTIVAPWRCMSIWIDYKTGQLGSWISQGRSAEAFQEIWIQGRDDQGD